MNVTTTELSDKRGKSTASSSSSLHFMKYSLAAIFLFPADTAEQSHKQFEDNQTAACSNLSHGPFFKVSATIEIDGITDYGRWDPQFCVTLRCILFHRTVLHTAVLWLWSDTKADKSLQKHRGQQCGHWGVGTCKITSCREQKSQGQLLTPQPHTMCPEPRSSTWSWCPLFTCT